MKRREIQDDEWVSQRVWVNDDEEVVILNAPRPKDNDRLSVILGRLTPAEAYKRVRLQARRIPPCDKDGVRHARVSDLRRAGFDVQHEPSNRNPEHALVGCDDEWDTETEARFEACFGERVWHHGDVRGA